MPQNLFDHAGGQTGATVLDMQIRAEQAASLGHAGSVVESRLQTLKAAAAEDPARPGLVIAAAEAVHAYLIQLELVGVNFPGNYDSVIDGFAIPREVMAKVGAKG
jgi:hypothetical protein